MDIYSGWIQNSVDKKITVVYYTKKGANPGKELRWTWKLTDKFAYIKAVQINPDDL